MRSWLSPDLEQRALDAGLLIVDFDGTLATLEIDWDEARSEAVEVARRAGVPCDAGLTGIMDGIRAADGPAFLRLCAAMTQREKTGFREWNRPLLALLRRRCPRPWSVCSGNTRWGISLLLHRPDCAAGHPRAVIGRENVTRGKPDPEGLLLALRVAGFGPGDALFVGDSDADRQAGAGAGVETMILGDEMEAT